MRKAVVEDWVESEPKIREWALALSKRAKAPHLNDVVRETRSSTTTLIAPPRSVEATIPTEAQMGNPDLRMDRDNWAHTE